MANLVEYLNNLERLDLVTLANSDPDLEYAFKHVFTQESVYSSLLRSDRRQIHQHVGQVLEEHLPDALEDGDMTLLLAYHFEQSGDKPRAIKYLQRAAENARADYANREAETLYHRMLLLLAADDYRQRWEALAGLESVLDRLGGREQQADLLTQMQTLAELMEDDTCLAITHNRRATYFDKISEYQAAAEAASVGLRVATRSGNAHLQAQSLNRLALAAWRRFDYPEVQKWALQALESLRLVGDPQVRITSLFHLGKASYRLGQYDLALEYITAAEELTKTTDTLDDEATSQLILGWIYQRLGDYSQAVQHFEAKLKLRRTTGDRYGEATALSHLGWVAYDQGDPQVGLDYCRQALDISRMINDRENEAYALGGMGLNQERLNKLDAAAENYRAALTIHAEIGATTLAVFDQAGLARIALAQKKQQQAQAHIAPVVNWVQAGNAQKFWDPWIIYLSAYEVLTALGQTETARTILTEAHTVLHNRANEISDDLLRDCFLREVAANRQLEETWHAVSRGHGAS